MVTNRQVRRELLDLGFSRPYKRSKYLREFRGGSYGPCVIYESPIKNLLTYYLTKKHKNKISNIR